MHHCGCSVFAWPINRFDFTLLAFRPPELFLEYLLGTSGKAFHLAFNYFYLTGIES